MILLVALLASHVCSADGQPFAELHRDTHQMELGVCGSSEPPVIRRVEFIIDRPRDSMKIDVAVDKRWSFTATPKDLASIQTIRAPASAMRLTLHAPHYRDAFAELAKSPSTISLRRIPVLRGRVLSPSGQPLVSASVEPNCLTGTDGVFDCEIGGEWPRAISVTYPKMATKIIAIDKGERDIDLGDIRLSLGAALAIRLDAPEAIRSVTLMLFRDDTQIAERRLQLPLAQPVAFSNLETGTLRLLIKGSRPLQQRSATVVIKDGDNEQAVSIRESELTLHVLAGARPEPGASIVLKSLDGKWSGSTETDDSGTSVEPLWQRGVFTAAVRTRSSASPLFDHAEFDDGDQHQWTLYVPNGRIEGIVRDDAGTSIAGAAVHLTSDNGEMTTAVHTKSDADGRFAFDGVRSGSQSIMAEADGYLPSDATQFQMVENEELRRADLMLRRGKRVAIDIVDRRGAPVAGAAVVAMLDSAMLARALSDGNGRAEVQLPPSGSPVMFVFPSTGSFAIHRVTSVDRDSSAIRINVPEPVASLELKTETTEHKPVRDVYFLVRYDGENIPPDLLLNLMPFKTGADGTATIPNLPLGLYELWPFAKATDIQDAPAPLRLALTPGPNSATLTFRSAHR
jgi:carboxypeptidase family protein